MTFKAVPTGYRVQSRSPQLPEWGDVAHRSGRRSFLRDKSFALFQDAVRRGIIDGGQAEALMALWLERHPYEPVEKP